MKKILYSNLYQKLSFFYLLLLSFIVQPQIVQAQINNPVTGDLGQHDATVTSGGKFIEYTVYLWRASITIGSLAVIAYFLMGAFTWITSGGDTSKLEKARNQMTHAIIGLVLLVSSFVLLGFMSKLLFGGEFDLLRLTIPGVN
jgi:hypothetical protein